MIYPWHDAVWQQVGQARRQGHLPHALLMTGDSGCGHDDFVDTLAKSLLCLHPDDSGLACGTCRSCQVHAAGAHPDFILTTAPDDKAVIAVDQIRQLNHFLALSRSYSPVKVVILRAAERMNVNAANSLLKSLEEPADNTHLILTSENPNQLLITIRSRCQQLRLPLPTREQGLAWLQQQQTVQPAAQLLELAAGRPLAALAFDDGEWLSQQAIWLQQLIAVLTQQSSIAQVAVEWSKFPKLRLLDWQLRLSQQFLRWQALSCEMPDGQVMETEPALAELFAQVRHRPLWALYDELLALKALAAHPLNNVLFCENMLALWRK